METSAPQQRSVTLQLAHQSDAASNYYYSHPAHFVVDSLSQIIILRYYCIGVFGGQTSRSSTGLLHYCTSGLEAANDAQNVMVDIAGGKDNDEQDLSICQKL